MKTKRSIRGNSLVGMLVTVAIILVLVVVFFKGSHAFGMQNNASPRADKHGTTVIGQVRYDAKDDVCRSNLGQVRSAIMIYQSSNDDHFPDNLQELKLPNEFYSCPIDHEPYQYDPTTGTVHCVHPGHERY